MIGCRTARLRVARDLVELLIWSEITPRQTYFRMARAGTRTSVTVSSKTNRNATRRLTLVIIAATQNSVMGNGLDRERPTEAWWTVPLGLRDLVGKRGSCNLPSMTIDYAGFVESMWAAVEKGFVMRERANFVAEGLLRGYDLGVDTGALRGARVFGNYASATKGSAREAVCKAIKKRVDTKKTIKLGVWSQELKEQLGAVFGDYTIFPLGAVPKRDSPEECRPISDHSRSGLNAATNLEPFRHTLTAYADVARFLKRGYAMAVADVRSAFSCLPLNLRLCHYRLWPHFLFKYYEYPMDEEEVVYMYLHGDFGAASMPGTWYIFFSEVVVPMARAVGVLTVPMAVYV